jgi:hypothetical protein
MASFYILSQSVYGHKLHCTNSGAKSGTECAVVNHNFCVLCWLHCCSFNTYNFAFRFMLHLCDTTISFIKVFYLPTDAQWSCFKRILKFTLKHLIYVWVQSPPSGSVLFELAKVTVVKIIS